MNIHIYLCCLLDGHIQFSGSLKNLLARGQSSSILDLWAGTCYFIQGLDRLERSGLKICPLKFL